MNGVFWSTFSDCWPVVMSSGSVAPEMFLKQYGCNEKACWYDNVAIPVCDCRPCGFLQRVRLPMTWNRWQFEKKNIKQWAAVDAQRLYLCADDVYCLDIATGRLLWEFGTFGTHSSAPVIAGERLFFQCGGLYALDAATGAVLWEFWTKTWATVSPAADTGRVYAPVGDQLYCLDAASGKLLWTAQTGSLEKAPVLIGRQAFFQHR